MHDGIRSPSPVARGVGIEARQEIHRETQARPLPRNGRLPRQRRHLGAPLWHARSVSRGWPLSGSRMWCSLYHVCTTS